MSITTLVSLCVNCFIYLPRYWHGYTEISRCFKSLGYRQKQLYKTKSNGGKVNHFIADCRDRSHCLPRLSLYELKSRESYQASVLGPVGEIAELLTLVVRKSPFVWDIYNMLQIIKIKFEIIIIVYTRFPDRWNCLLRHTRHKHARIKCSSF